MQRMLRRKRFKFVVTLVLLLTFIGTSIPLEGFTPQKAYAAEQGALKDDAGESISFLEKALKIVSRLIKGAQKTAGAVKSFIEETIRPNVIPNAKDAPDIPEKTINSKTKDLGDGKYKTTIHTEPIHFENDDGELEDIDNRAVETSKPGFAYENKANDFKIFFAENTISEKLVRIDFDKRLIEWKILDAAHSKISAKDNIVTYKNTFKDVDLKYTIENTKLKEELILKSSKAPNAYKFRLNLKNIYYKKRDGRLDRLLRLNHQREGLGI